MSSPDRRGFLALMLLAGCGFAPAYAPTGPAAGLTGQIRVAEPDTKNGFDLVQRLEERLGRAGAVRYDLAFTLTTRAIGVGITPENATTRFNLTGEVVWTLTDIRTDTRVTGGRAQSFTSWSATGSTVAGLAAEEDAGLRLMRILADRIVQDLLATAGAWAK